MSLTPKFVHRRSLTIASLTVVACFVLCSGILPLYIAAFRATGAHYFTLLISFLLCGWAWLNLIRDVDRGYSPSKSSLAAILLLAASLLPILYLALSSIEIRR